MSKNIRTAEQKTRLIDLRARIGNFTPDEATEYAAMTDYPRMAKENLFSTTCEINDPERDTCTRVYAALALRGEELRLRCLDAPSEGQRARNARARLRITAAIAVLNGDNTDALRLLKEIQQSE